MRFINVVSVPVLAAAILVASWARADTFDDAVNHYLSGFDYCSAAKSALADNNLARARSEFGRYEAVKKQAANMDKSILSTDRREMDSNIKYCERVGTDIELAVGKPVLDKALAECDQAYTQMKQGNAEPANAHYQQFLALRDEALGVAPSINTVFSLRSEIRRCERLKDRMASLNQQHAALGAATAAALDSSERFQSGCEAGAADLQKLDVSASDMQAARQRLTVLQGYQKEARSDAAALKAAAKEGAVPEQATVDGFIQKGDSCLTKLSAGLAEKERQLKAMQDVLKSNLAQVNRATESCKGVSALSPNQVTQAQFDRARSGFESARKTRDDAKAALAKNPLPGDAESRRLGAAVATLDECLNRARPQLEVLLGSLNAAAAAKAAAAVPKPAPVAAAPAAATTAAPKVAIPQPQAVEAKVQPVAKTKVPAQGLAGTLEIQGALPEFVLLYWLDGSEGPAEQDIQIQPARFDQTVYVLRPGGTLNFRSDDFASHTIKGMVKDSEQELVQIRSRQRRSVSTRWPQNSIVVLSSEHARVSSAFIANVPSDHYNLLRFEGDDRKLKLELLNPQQAIKGFMLMPGYDVVAFELGQGEEVTLPVKHLGAELGSVRLKGL